MYTGVCLAELMMNPPGKVGMYPRSWVLVLFHLFFFLSTHPRRPTPQPNSHALPVRPGSPFIGVLFNALVEANPPAADDAAEAADDAVVLVRRRRMQG